MRKQVLFGAALLALGTAVVSCSKDEVVIDNTPGVETPAEDGVQELILNMNSAGDGLTTRGGRPLYSSEAAQEIDKVVIKIIDRTESGHDGTKGKVVSSITIENWQEVSKQYTVGGHGRMYTFKLSKEQKVPAGTYEIYAIGYTSTNSSYDFGAYESWDDTNDFEYQTQTLKPNSTEAEEVFAGSIKTIEVDDQQNFVLTANAENNVLTLHRQVAGVIGYYSNIPTLKSGASMDETTGVIAKAKNYPAYVQGLKLRLVSTNASDKIVFAGFNSDFTETGDKYKFIVNGSRTTSLTADAKFDDPATVKNDAYTLYEIPLKDWFVGGDANNDGMLDLNDNRDDNGNVLDNWVSPYSTVAGLEFEEASVFAGKFVIPFAKVANTQKTLELQLVVDTPLRDDASGIVPGYEKNAVVRSWKINLSESDPQVVGESGANVHAQLVTTEGKTVNFTPQMEERYNSYSVVRNHLYTVGTKGTNDYNPDTDEPQDLSKGQELILKVNDNWELIHKMEVE